MDLCEQKKFIDLNDDIFMYYKNEELASILDSKNNFWKRGEKIEEGGSGEVVTFESGNSSYSDLAIKFFFDYKKNRRFIEEELGITMFFIKNRCRNFINIGVKELISDEAIVVMEKIDGDLYNFDFNKFKNPKFIFNEFVKFLVDGYKCALGYNKYFLDIKEENIGYKLCKKSIKFVFLDFGSFVEKNQKNVSSTLVINNSKNKRGYFSNEMLLAYGTIITLLILRLKVVDKKYGIKFSNFIYDELECIKRYPMTNLLTLENYEKIKEKFYQNFHKDDEFVIILFKLLHSLTKKEPDIKDFINKLDVFH